MDFENYLKETGVKLDREVERILGKWLKEIEKTGQELVPLAKAFIKACRGGKAIRGTLVKLGYELGKGKREPFDSAQGERGKGKDILKIAAAYEIFHTGILAHDDIIDQSPTRRDKPSLYKSVGVSQAITLADLGFFLAVKIIAESNFSDKIKNEALKLFAKTMVDTAVGQMLDIQKGLPAGPLRRSFSEASRQGDPLIIMKLKTAKYTIAGPLQLGAILAGADDKLIKALGQFGENAGIAFQIQDDILDGEVKSGQSAHKECLEYANKAKKLIPQITKDEKLVKLLEEMTEYLVERRK